MRRHTMTTLGLAIAGLLLGCESPPAPGSGETSATMRGPLSSGAPVSSGLAPLSPSARADLPMAPASATAREEPKQVAAQHVLIAWKGAEGAPKKVTRSKADAKKLAEEVATKAKGGEDFTELVKKHSDEPGAAERLGSVGKFERDAMAKPFADAAFALEVGKVSDAVETKFGFHVIKRNQ